MSSVWTVKGPRGVWSLVAGERPHCSGRLR